MKKLKHKCKELKYCMCSITALEPDESCIIHGVAPNSSRCSCGKFVKRKKNFNVPVADK